MAGTTSVPRVQFTPTGLVTPDETAIKAGAFADMNAAFGGNLSTRDSSPQGQLVVSQAAIIGAANDLFLEFVNNINPDTASGFMQDAIARIYFLDRLPALPTVVQVTCYGKTGTVIPVGALVKDGAGNVYAATEEGTIPAGGSVVIEFAAQVYGPINCPAGAIEAIPVKIIPGWDSAANLTDGVVGRLVESRVDFEYRRRQSVALNAHGTMPSIYANVFNLDGVTDVYAIDNVKDTPLAVGSTAYTLIKKSIYVAVVGGDDDEIARTIWTRKDVGADYNGNVTVVVEDENYDIPRPSYPVQFNRPTATPIKFAVSIANIPGLPSDIVTRVRAAIVSAFYGGDGGQRARIAATIFAGRFYAPVSASAPNVAIISLLLGAAAPTATSFTTGIDQYPTIDPENISVTVV
jgi:hypothetical protein